jgi:hypothetical protein
VCGEERKEIEQKGETRDEYTEKKIAEKVRQGARRQRKERGGK